MNLKRIKLLILLPALLLTLFESRSNLLPERAEYRLGITGGVTYVRSQTSLPIYSSLTDCGNFSNGRAIGYYAGISGMWNFSEYVALGSRLLFDNRPAKLTATSAQFEVFDPISESYEPLVREHTFDAEIKYLSFDIGLSTQFLPVDLRVSVDAGYPLISADYENSEEIISPAGYLFSDETKRHVAESGEIQNLNINYGLSVAVSKDIYLDNGLILTPEISYRHALNSVVSSSDFNMQIIRAGIIVSIDFDKKEEPIPEPEPPIEEPKDTVELAEEKPAPTSNKPEILEFAAVPLNFTETVVTQSYPLLPYVFFDSASNDIQSKMLPKDIDRRYFSELMLPKNTLGIYYHLADIFGSRLQREKSIKIVIEGFTDGKELDSLDDRLSLAGARAEAVADYWEEKWNIDPDRISIKSGDVSEKPTSTLYSEGYAENRRIEISADNIHLFHPVVHSKFLEYTVDDKEFAFHLDIDNSSTADSMKIRILQGQDELAEYSVDEYNGKTKKSFDWKFASELGRRYREFDTLNAVLLVYTGDEIIEKTVPIEIKITQNKYEVGRLNLIVFDFDRSVISPVNKDLINDFVKESIHSNSQVWITGSTDRLGEKNYNMRLSQARAESVRDYIKSIRPTAQIKEVKGIGDSILLYDNDLPEGRFYSRTVLVEVKTPID